MSVKRVKNKIQTYWMGDIMDAQQIEAHLNILKRCCAGAFNCSGCLITEYFTDKDGFTNFNELTKFILKCRREYAAKSPLQKQELIYKIYEECLMPPRYIIIIIIILAPYFYALNNFVFIIIYFSVNLLLTSVVRRGKRRGLRVRVTHRATMSTIQTRKMILQDRILRGTVQRVGPAAQIARRRPRASNLFPRSA